jgi:hypothetical protein
MTMTSLVGRLSGPADVVIFRDEAVFAPAPLPLGATASARFVLGILPVHPCPDPAIPFTLTITAAPGCETTLPFTLALTNGTSGGGMGMFVPEVPNGSVRVEKRQPSQDALRVSWDPVALSPVTYNIYRGSVAALHAHAGYNHVASRALGVGACTTPDTFMDDGDDLFDAGSLYYLVTAEASCGLEGTTGFDSLGTERPAGGGCP